MWAHLAEGQAFGFCGLPLHRTVVSDVTRPRISVRISNEPHVVNIALYDSVTIQRVGGRGGGVVNKVGGEE